MPIVTTRSDLVKEFEEPDHDLATDTLGLVDGNGDMVAFMRSSMRPDPTRQRVAMVTGRVLPEWTRLGLGRRLIEWAIDRSRTRLREHTDELPQLIRAYVYEDATGAVRAFEACGFTPERYFVELTRDLAQPPSMDAAADGVEITPWSPGVDEAVRVAHNAAFLDHWASEPLSEIRWNRWISGNESFLPTASFVAQADGEVVGYSVNFAYPEEWEGIGHSEGWIEALARREIGGRRASLPPSSRQASKHFERSDTTAPPSESIAKTPPVLLAYTPGLDSFLPDESSAIRSGSPNRRTSHCPSGQDGVH